MLAVDAGLLPALFVACLTSLSACAIGLVLVQRVPFRSRQKLSSGPSRIFLFDGADLVDATPAAHDILARATRSGTDWDQLLSVLSPHFPNLATLFLTLDDDRFLEIRSTDRREHLTAEFVNDRIRVVLSDGRETDGRVTIDSMIFRAMLRELETVRSTVDGAQFLAWRERKDGELLWSNQTYRALRSRHLGVKAASTDPRAPLFDRAELRQALLQEGSRRMRPVRASKTDEGAEWYECSGRPVGEDRLYLAVPIDSAVRAEHQLRDFMQTLTNTFSHLTTGLAVFDRDRNLALFNPALTDLTGLPIPFLTTRPSLFSLLDQLRERRMIPEPKDYGSWRRQIADLEAAALDGSYTETWQLADGRTFRVSGRPHHNGALALLLEDISSEMALTRRFRSEIELGQAVIDHFDDAVAVFAPDGTLSLVNKAYQILWGASLTDTIDAPSVTEMSRIWMARGASTLWGEIRDFVLHARDRTEWAGSVTLVDRTGLSCRVAPIVGGSTMVRFRIEESGDAVPEQTPRIA